MTLSEGMITMMFTERLANYRKQNKSEWRITPAQRKRAQKKAGRFLFNAKEM